LLSGLLLALVLAGRVYGALNVVDKIDLHPAGPGAMGASHVCIDQSARRAYFSGTDTRNIAVIDLDTHQVTGFLDADGRPRQIDADEVAHQLCYSLPDDVAVGIVSELGGPVVKAGTGGGAGDPRGVASCDSTGRVYAANFNGFAVAAIKRPENVLETTISLPDGLRPQCLACDHSRKRLYVGCFRDWLQNVLLVIDADPASQTFHHIIDRFSPTRYPCSIAVNETANRVTVIDVDPSSPTRRQVEKLIVIDSGPHRCPPKATSP